MRGRDRHDAASGAYAIPRLLTGVAALPPTVYALLILANLLRTGFDPLAAIFGACAGAVAVLCWWFALRGHVAEARRRMRFTLIGGFVLGGIGFAAGFFGPILLKPSANQGPLLGILVTGPLGFALGAGIGWLYAAALLKNYDIGKGSIRFTVDRPLPAALVTTLVKARIAENEKRAARL